METWKVLAVDTDYTFTSRQDSQKVHGVKLLLSDPTVVCGDRTRFRGFQWMEQFISDERLKALNVQPLPGDTVVFIFNRHGSIEKLEIVPAA